MSFSLSNRRPLKRWSPAIEKPEGRDLPTAPTLYARPPKPTIQVQQEPTQDLAPRGGQAKFAFTARFSGSFATSPALYRDQASQTFIRGGGLSPRFLHGNLQMAVYTPADANAPTTGLPGIFDKNVANTGSQLILQLEGNATSVDRAGPPRSFNWTVSDGSGGFSGASGEGTVEIRYSGGRKQPSGATRAGKAFVIFKGQVVTDNGVGQLLTLGL